MGAADGWSSPAPYVASQDGVSWGFFTKVGSGPWKAQIGGEPVACLEVRFFPRAVVTAWSFRQTQRSSGAVGATPIDYDVVVSKRSATPVRFDPAVADRLASFVAANPGMSLSSAANRLVDEALRMAEHPGVIFRSGPTGRRAALAGGPDVWEVIRAIKSAHAAEPGLNSDDLVSLVSDNTGIAPRRVNTAVRYWAAYPGEVDAEIAAAAAAEEAAEQAWLRERQLLAG
jgi:hypothetical protein